MTVNNLPARRTTSAVVVASQPKPSPVRPVHQRPREGLSVGMFLGVAGLALVTMLFAMVLLSVMQPS